MTRNQQEHGDGRVERQGEPQSASGCTMNVATPEQHATDEEENRRSRNGSLPTLRHCHCPDDVYRQPQDGLFERVLQGGLEYLGLWRALGQAAAIDVLRSEESVSRQQADVHRERDNEKHVPFQGMS